LNDGHVSLEGDSRSFSSGMSHEPYDAAAIDTFIVHDVLKDKARHGANGNLTWGWVSPGVGYVNVASMYLGTMPLPTQIDQVDQAMTQVIADLGRAKALIVDARFNTGGYDAIALRIIGYLTRERRLAFTKKAVAGSGYTDPQEVYFEPQGKRQFTGPVYYLQSNDTVSAGEIFSLAMMARPNVVRVGTPTYGIFSDALAKKLPNGWVVGVSNEIYTAVDGKVYEGRGVPPNIPVTVPNGASFPDRMRLDINTALAQIGR
jgi:C-terminal processing protease CtpA/Prc